jgi:hypothetical protein
LGSAAQISAGIGQVSAGSNNHQGFYVQFQGGSSTTTIESIQINHVTSAAQVYTNALTRVKLGQTGYFWSKQWVDGFHSDAVDTGLPISLWASTYSVLDAIFFDSSVPTGQDGTGADYFTQIVVRGNGTVPTFS